MMIEDVRRKAAQAMASTTALIRRFGRDQSGATAIEYCLLLAMISVACIGAFKAVGGATGGGWGDVANKAGNAMK